MHKNAAYRQKIREMKTPSPTLKNCLFASTFGGTICAVGELLFHLFSAFSLVEEDASLYVTVTLIVLSAILTAVGLYDRIARVGGAGTLVPVTGFANAVVSPALDTGNEGLIVGVGSAIFTVAGPVIVYGMLAGALYGVVLLVFGGAL